MFQYIGVKNYWFGTATPTLLLDLLKKTPLDLENLTASEESFSVYEVENPSVLPLLVQTGYLTITNTYEDGEERIFQLGFPNREIRVSFSKSVVKSFSYTEQQSDSI